MATTLLTMEKANLFCGALPTTGNDSLHLELTELKLPAMNQGNVDHRAAGAPLTIEIDTQIAKLECTFQLVGWDAQVATLIASWQAQLNMFFAYGLLRDRSTGIAVQAAAYMKGRLGLADPQMFRAGDAMHWNYGIKDIVHYELVVGGNQLYFWDFFANAFTVGTNDIMFDINNTLNIPIVTPQPVLQAGTAAGLSSISPAPAAVNTTIGT